MRVPTKQEAFGWFFAPVIFVVTLPLILLVGVVSLAGTIPTFLRRSCLALILVVEIGVTLQVQGLLSVPWWYHIVLPACWFCLAAVLTAYWLALKVIYG